MIIHYAISFGQFVRALPHWRGGDGYQFWSGLGSVILQVSLIIAPITAAIVLYRRLWLKRVRPHLECHEETCHKIGLHPVAGTSFRTCWVHHPELGKHPHRHIPLAHIHAAHSENTAALKNMSEAVDRLHDHLDEVQAERQ